MPPVEYGWYWTCGDKFPSDNNVMPVYYSGKDNVLSIMETRGFAVYWPVDHFSHWIKMEFPNPPIPESDFIL